VVPYVRRSRPLGPASWFKSPPQPPPLTGVWGGEGGAEAAKDGEGEGGES
jgi:hypothetical protein